MTSTNRRQGAVRRTVKRVAAILGTAAAVATIVATAHAVPANAATLHRHGTLAADNRMCAAFQRWSDAGGTDTTDGRWSRYLPGTDRYIYADGRTLAWVLETDAPAVVKRSAFEYLYMDCNPDA